MSEILTPAQLADVLAHYGTMRREGQTLAALAATSGGGRIPACAGHSG